MKRTFLLLLCITARMVLAQCSQPATGFGCDVPTAVSCTASNTDATKATCTWTTTKSSDSEVTIIDAFGNGAQTIYNPTMGTSHTVNLTALATGAKLTFYVSSCTHATFTGTGECPRTSQDWSSTGPQSRMSTIPSFTTISRPAGTLTSWYSVPQAPTTVFQGQEWFILNKDGVGIGTIGATGVNFLLLHDLVITSNTSYGATVQCGFNNTGHTPNYFAYGDSTFFVACKGGATTADFVLVPTAGTNWIPNSAHGLNNASVVGNSGNMFTAHQAGYFYNSWGGGDANIYVKVGASVPAGNYTITYHLQPLNFDGTGNETGGVLVGQDKVITVPITVQSLTPLANNPPTSFPAWSFQPQLLAEAAYWGTWSCSNSSSSENRSGKGPWAMYQNSGVFENIYFSINNWGEWAWNYDGGRNNLALSDRLFATAHPVWAANHTYTIGDIITVNGKSFIMNAVSGASSPGLTGNSGLTQPAFGTIAPPQTIADSVLQWLAIGDQPYWAGCALKANDGYRNNILTMQALNNEEPDMFPSGILMSFYRTGDASPGDSTGFSYTETNAKFGGAGTFGASITSANGTAAMCQTANDANITESGTGTYWTGGDRLALCYGASSQALFGNQPNGNNITSARIKALQLQELVAYWMLKNDATFLTSDDGLRMQRFVETAISLISVDENLSTVGSASANLVNVGPVAGGIQPFYQFGQLSEALLHYYQATVFYNTSGFNPTGPDERIPVVLKQFADWAWVNAYDRIYDKNQIVTDVCNAAHPTICTNNNSRLHSHAFPYNFYGGPSDKAISNEFDTESASNSEISFIYSWLWSRNNTMVPPSNGRITVGSYRDIAQEIMSHVYDGRGCTNRSASTAGNCTSWGVQDFFNGGRTVGQGFNSIVNGSKTIQQASVNSISEGLPWLDGEYTSTQGVMLRATNPCWIVANQGAGGACTTPSPFPDVQQPYPMNMYISNGRPAVADPTICLPGLVGNQITSTCVASLPFGSNHVAMNGGASTITSNSATFNLMTIKKPVSVCVVVGTGVTEPTHNLGTNFFCAGGTPTLAGSTPAPMWYSTVTASGLLSSTIYHFGLYITDSANNVYNFPYQIGGTTGKVGISFGGLDQAQTFLTQPAPPGANITIQFGAAMKGGTTAR